MTRPHSHSADDAVRDQHLLARIKDGDTAAVGDLYDTYGRLVFSLVLRILGDGAVSEDVVQEVFVRAWRSAATYRPELGSVRAWLLAIAHNRAIDEWRRRRNEVHRLSLDEMRPDGLGVTEDHASDPLVYQALKALPREQRQVLELAYFHGLTVNEIAARLQVPPGTVKSRVRLALIKLRAQLGVDKDWPP